MVDPMGQRAGRQSTPGKARPIGPCAPYVQHAQESSRPAAEILQGLEKVPPAADQALALARDMEQLATCNDPARVRSQVLAVAAKMRDLADEVEALSAALAHVLAQHAEQGEALLAARQAAHRDALTGLANRRWFDQTLSALIAEGRPFVLALVDVDHFKRINDTHGHPAGDQALRELAGLLQRRVRESDTVARIGGEEFALLLPDTTLATGARIAEKVRTAIEQRTLRRASDRHCPLRLTVSVGVAEYRHGETGQEVLSRADAALYRAKHNDRNQVVLATAQAELAIE